MSNEKFEVGSEGWINTALVIARELVEAGLASGELSRDDQYTIVETYNGVPTHISENGSVTWGLRLEDGEVSLISAVPENADKRVRGDYEVTLPIARAPYIAEVIPMPATQALVRKALAQRRLVVLGGEQGDRPRPAVLNGLHNRLVEVTA